MSEQQPLSDGRVLWVQEECHDLVKIYHDAQAPRDLARERILHTLYFEMREDGMHPAAHREAVETILDAELERVYK